MKKSTLSLLLASVSIATLALSTQAKPGFGLTNSAGTLIAQSVGCNDLNLWLRAYAQPGASFWSKPWTNADGDYLGNVVNQEVEVTLVRKCSELGRANWYQVIAPGHSSRVWVRGSNLSIR